MMLTHAICVLFAPALACGAALEWALPEPTINAPAADNWSPAPTPAPRLPGFELFKRQTTTGDNTCGYVSGSLASSITCPNKNLICATDTRNGVHGCCDPKSLAENSCTIPTTCIASTAMSTLCTDSFCSNAADVVRCTESALPDCYQWIILYDKTSMTQHGCASKGFTSTALHNTGQLQSSIPPERYRTITVEVTPSATPTATQTASPSKPDLGAIVGGTIGGCVAISVLIVIAYFLYRRRKKARDSIEQPPITQFNSPDVAVTEYNPKRFPTPTLSESELKWQQHQGPVFRASDVMPQYPHMGTGHYGIVEVDGMQRPVEAPNEISYHARDYGRS